MGKNIVIVCMLLLSILATAKARDADDKQIVEDTPAINVTRVVVYYFYGNYRCASCRKIEQYTRETVEKFFPDELKSSRVVFKPVNVEEKENQHFTKEYQLYTKSVVLSLVRDGKEIKFKNLEKVWQLLRNKDKFYQYIKEETQGFLDELSGEDKT